MLGFSPKTFAPPFDWKSWGVNSSWSGSFLETGQMRLWTGFLDTDCNSWHWNMNQIQKAFT